jgi:hypothetical protein
VRPRESRKPSLPTASSGIVLDIPWIEADGREEDAVSVGLFNAGSTR